MSLTRVVLASGRSLELVELRLTSTYGGMLEGYPSKPLNDRKVDTLVAAAETAFPFLPVHLVPPPRERHDEPAGPFGPVEVLPSVSCVGSFHSTAVDPEHDPVEYRSGLTVVWYQPTPRVPAEHDADEGLRAIAWEELAVDYEL
ncbi:hypothetical protein [Streptomyces sp. MN13]